MINYKEYKVGLKDETIISLKVVQYRPVQMSEFRNPEIFKNSRNFLSSIDYFFTKRKTLTGYKFQT